MSRVCGKYIRQTSCMSSVYTLQMLRLAPATRASEMLPQLSTVGGLPGSRWLFSKLICEKTGICTAVPLHHWRFSEPACCKPNQIRQLRQLLVTQSGVRRHPESTYDTLLVVHLTLPRAPGFLEILYREASSNVLSDMMSARHTAET